MLGILHKFESISEGVWDFGSTALSTRLCEYQVWASSAKLVRDMNLIFSPAYRSMRGGTRTANHFFIALLHFSVEHLKVGTLRFLGPPPK